jgi:hypothetical protein
MHAAGAMAKALFEGRHFDATALAPNVADFLMAPACVIAGMLLWGSRAVGLRNRPAYAVPGQHVVRGMN